MIFRVAVGLARNSEPEHRWRRVVLPFSVAVFMLLLFAGGSIIAMVQREAGRVEQRTAIEASQPSPTDLFVVDSYEIWDGEPFMVAWIEPAGSAEPVLPPGMKRLPAPGQAVVSPALDRLASRHEELSARFPDRLVLGTEGVRSGDELFAYLRVPEGRTLAQDAGRDGLVLRARAFGPPAGGDSYLLLDSPFPMVQVELIAAGVLAFLVIPGLIVLTVGLAAASDVRDRRFEVLGWIGAPSRTLFTLAVGETMILALPALLVTTALWGLLAPRLEYVPLVGYTAIRGDLGLSWWLLLAGLGSGIVTTVVLASALTALRGSRGVARLRPFSGRTVVTPLRAVPLVVAAGAFLLGRTVLTNQTANLNILAILAAIVGAPLVLPSVLRAIGAALGKLEPVSVSIAGRGLQWDPVRAARPFLGAAALIVIALAGSGYLALARYIEAPPLPAGSAQAVVVDWLDPRSNDPDRLAGALETGLVAPIREDGEKLAVGATCQQLVVFFPGNSCAPRAQYEFPAEMERRLTETASAAVAPGMEIRLVPRDDIAASGRALVLDEAPIASLDERVRGAAIRLLPAPSVVSAQSFVLHESPLVPWLVGGIVVAMIVLTFGCLFSLVDRLLATRKHRRHLLNLGATAGRLTKLEALLFALPYGAVVAVSFSVGFTVCALMVGVSGISLPWRGIGLSLGVAVFIGFLGTASTAFFGSKRFRENME